jgi:hypothetical protein
MRCSRAVDDLACTDRVRYDFVISSAPIAIGLAAADASFRVKVVQQIGLVCT